MIQNLENTESWEDKAGKHKSYSQWQVGIAPISSFSRPISLHSTSIIYNVYPFESFTLSPFEKMLGSWYPEFVHIHVFIVIHEATI